MLESSSFTQSWYCFKFYILSSKNGLMKRGMEEFNFFFQPEDTSEKPDHRHSDCAGIGVADNTRSTVKVVLWLAVSVAVSLALGQLK